MISKVNTLQTLNVLYPKLMLEVRKQLKILENYYPPADYQLKYEIETTSQDYPAFLIKLYPERDDGKTSYVEIAIASRDGEHYSELILFGDTKAVDSWRLKN